MTDHAATVSGPSTSEVDRLWLPLLLRLVALTVAVVMRTTW